jgi:1-aminocyclopropane-1-carboxylate deaminase/D-cysteine desulfhydrase-like pyridoxal-dependent ACC family enzyme
MALLRQETPIEVYAVSGRQVFVKRDDLFGNYPAPPLGKLRGLSIVLQELHEQGVRLVGCWETRVSKLGQGLAALAAEYPDMRTIVSYPTRKGTPLPDSVRRAQELGAELLPLRGNHVSICYSQAKNHVTGLGGIMLPFGMECIQAVNAVAAEARDIPIDVIGGGTVVVCCGSGVTLSGLLLGLQAKPRRVIGISSGRSVRRIVNCISRYLPSLPEYLEIHPARMPYELALDYPCPFPSHPNYDLKAWKHLLENIDSFTDPVLFWNIGA